MEIKVFFVHSNSIDVQCYLFYKNGNGILVDPAGDFEIINSFLIDDDITLKAILITHSHKDHTELCNNFSQTYSVPVFMSAKEIDDYAFHCSNLIRLEHLGEFIIADFSITPILTPGHTSGSMCYLIDNNVFTGDTVFIEGVGVCIDEGSNVYELFNSIQFLKSYLPKNSKVWPGHSYGQLPGKNLEFLIHNNIYFQLGKEMFVNFRMRRKKNRDAST